MLLCALKSTTDCTAICTLELVTISILQFIDGARSAARTIQNNLLDSSKQEAINAIVAGGAIKTAMANLTTLYLPRNFVNGESFEIF
jgi:hypothetical protein